MRARATIWDDVYTDLLPALGLDETASLTIAEVSRQKHPEPQDGPQDTGSRHAENPSSVTELADTNQSCQSSAAGASATV